MTTITKKDWLTETVEEHKDFTVKGLKSWQTDDGGGYQGNLYYKGKKVAWFHQDGNGGYTNVQYVDKEAEALVTNYCNTIPAETVTEIGGTPISEPFTLKFNDERLIGAVCDNHDTIRDFKRKCKTKTIIIPAGVKEGQYIQFKIAFTPEIKERILEKHPKYRDVVFANEIL